MGGGVAGPVPRGEEMWSRRVVVVLVVGLLGVAGLTGCGSDGPEDGDGDGEAASDRSSSTDDAEAVEPECEARSATDEEPASTVELALGEYSVAPSSAEVPAGPIELVAANEGTIWHEIIVVRHDADSGSIPLNSAGGADLDQLPENAEVGRMLNFMAGTTCRATFDLEPGRYALICNLVDDGFNPHYSQGMHVSLTVT